jgi:hypothetical protein
MFIDNLTALTDYDIIKIADELKIKEFRGVFMRDTLPKQISNKVECAILLIETHL